jgi:hypothetical protein
MDENYPQNRYQESKSISYGRLETEIQVHNAIQESRIQVAELEKNRNVTIANQESMA